MLKTFRDQKGQGLTEYIIIVALIAIAAIGVVTLFGNNIRALFGAGVKALGGQNQVQVNTTDQTESVERKRTLKTFAEDQGAK